MAGEAAASLILANGKGSCTRDAERGTCQKFGRKTERVGRERLKWAMDSRGEIDKDFFHGEVQMDTGL